MSKEPNIEEPIDPEVEESIEDEKAKRRPARRVANQAHGKRLRQMRTLLKSSEEDVKQAIADAGLTGQEALNALRIWRAHRS